MATVESRIKVASDIIALRLQRKISIRLSATRESDRFSRVQFGALETLHQASLTDAQRHTALQLTCINVYFSRCCLSERSRKAMHEGRFPFFSRPLRSLTIQGLLDTLSDAFINLLQATDYAPYGKRKEDSST